MNPTIGGVPAYRLSIKFALSAPEEISYTVYGPDTVSLSAGSLPPNSGQLICSFDGSGIDAVMLSTGAQLVYDQPGYVTESGYSTGVVLSQSAIVFRFTVQQITVQDAFNGQPNNITIAASSGSSAFATIAGINVPDQQGIALTPIGVLGQKNELQFPFFVDAALQLLVLDVDVNQDTVLDATQTIMDHAGSFIDPQQTQWYIDSGDQGPDGIKGVFLGHKGRNTYTFGGTDLPQLRGTMVQAQSTDMCASCSFTGGDTTHGLPDTGRITAMTEQGFIGFYGSPSVGGVYYWTGAAFTPISQAMGVNALWYDFGGTSKLYAATDKGAYSNLADPNNTAAWLRMGAMSLKCLKVQNEGGKVYVLAVFSNGDTHVLKYTPGTTTGVGYNDWTSITSAPNIIDFAIMDTYCYCVLDGVPGALSVQVLTGGEAPLSVQGAGSFAIIGLDAISSDGNQTDTVMIRTDAGSAGLFYLTTLQPLIPLQADFDGSVMINKITANGDGFLSCSAGTSVSLMLAATSAGVWTTSDANGAHNWKRTDGQSSIGDFNCSTVAIGPGGSSGVQGRDVSPVYAAADNSFYVSMNGSYNWIDALARPVDAGPLFTEALGFGLGTSFIEVQYGGQTFRLYRSFDGINQFIYYLVNPLSESPSAQHRVSELSQISTSALLSPLDASRVLVEAMGRFLAYTSRPQKIIEIQSRYDISNTSSPLRKIRPTDQILVTENPQDILIAPGQTPYTPGTFAGTYYVLEHTQTYDRDQDRASVTTLTRAASLLLADRTSPDKVVDDLIYRVSRMQLYRGKSGT